MKNKILIFGQGFIGRRLHAEFKSFISNRRIKCLRDVEEEIKRFKPSIIINCIGYTGVKTVDDCEKAVDETLFANSFLPLILAEAALRNRIRLIHISSGCIYHFNYLKDAPLSEERIPDFFELFYSRTKIYPEQPLEILSKKFPILVVRIRIPLDNRPHPRNLLTKLINYRRVIDLPNSITYIPDFIEALKHLIKKKASGIYNVVNKGALKYERLMETYKKYVPNFEYQVIEFKKLNSVRTNLILSTRKLEKAGFKIRNINAVLGECVQGYLAHEKKI